MAIQDEGGALLGVVSAEISFDSVVGAELVPASEGVREIFLVDDAGRIMVRSTDLDVRARAKHLDEVHPTPPFPYPALIGALKAPSGYLELPDALLTWQHLHRSHWSLVVEAEPL
jgi:hypothetical protein